MSNDLSRMMQAFRSGLQSVADAVRAPAPPLSYNFATHRLGPTAPNGVASGQLGPGYYSLSTLSGVPYVQIAGGQGKEKLLSWGEMIHVPEGWLVSVLNASYHPGDVVLNSGQDYAAMPSALTVPASLTDDGNSQTNVQIPLWFCDVRRARRAYYVADLVAGNAGATITVRSEAVQRTHDVALQTAIFQSTFAVAPGAAVPPIPLGYEAQAGTPSHPHALLDRATVFIDFDEFSETDTQGYYVVEYS